MVSKNNPLRRIVVTRNAEGRFRLDMAGEKVYPRNVEHKRIVEEAGGIYVPGMLGNLVLFNSAATGSTLALPEDRLTVETVRKHIAESNARFGVKS